MQKQINILENDVQRCQKQSLDFELQLQHEKERRKCEYSLKNICETSWISKMEKLESENISLEFQHVHQKTYTYVEVRAENQDLLITIYELKAKLKNVEKGLKAASNVRGPSNSDSSFKNSALFNTKKSSERIVTDVDVQNALKAKDVLCVSCAKNVLILCHDKCLANYKLNVHSNIRRALFTTPRTTKSTFVDTTPVVSKTRFSVKTTQSKFVDTNPVISKTRIAVVTPLSAKNKVSSAPKTITVILRGSSLSKYMKNKIQTSRMWQKWYALQPNVVQTVLWIVDSGCLKHITGDRTLLINFIEKFLGTVCFGNDHFKANISYGDYVQGNITVCHVYYVEGLGHNLFSVGQLCDGDLEVALCSKACYVQNQEGDNLLTGACKSNLYTISISNMAASSPVCLLSKATSTKSWLSHHRLSHLNFGTINDLTKHDLVDGLPKLKYSKDHLCSACEQGKSKKSFHQPNIVPITHSKLELLHMDLDSIEFDGNTLLTPYDAPDFAEVEPSTTCLDPSNMHEFHQVQPTTHIWTKAHPLEQVIGDPYKHVMTRKGLQTDSDLCMYALTVSIFEPKNIKEAMSDHCWIESMQDELHLFKRLDVWELVPILDGKNIIAVKWIWKNKNDAEYVVIRNKSCLVGKGYKQEEGIDFKESFAPVTH
ncbi:integrase, catalytic region, zinc finger, CCHC-type containing protein [Tanacetum coccineum]